MTAELTSTLVLGIVHRDRLVREACKRALRSSGIEVAFSVDCISTAPSPRKSASAQCLLMQAGQISEQPAVFAQWLDCASVLLFQDASAVDASYRAIENGALGTIEAPALNDSGEIIGKSHFLATLQRFSRSIKCQNKSRHGPEVAAQLGTTERAAALEFSDQTALQNARRHPIIIALGASTGGPNAIAHILRGLPASLPASVLIVQHIEQDFTQGLAEWLGEHSEFGVQIAERGAQILPGQAYVAPPNRHLVIDTNGLIAHRVGAPSEIHTPSIDVMFESLSINARPGLAALLTGMGRDGALGLRALKNAGWHTIAQDEASSAVYGMPRAAVELGAESQTLKLSAIAQTLVRHVLTQVKL